MSVDVTCCDAAAECKILIAKADLVLATKSLSHNTALCLVPTSPQTTHLVDIIQRRESDPLIMHGDRVLHLHKGKKQRTACSWLACLDVS